MDKESEFFNRSIKSWLQDNDIEKYSTHNEVKSVVAERFIRTLKNKIDLIYMTLISKNMYIDKLDDIHKYSNTYYSTIKMKPVDENSTTHNDFNKENNNKDRKFEVDDHVKVSKYKNIFPKCYTPNWPEELFAIKKVKNTVLRSYVISDLNGEEIVRTFYEKKIQKTKQKNLEMKKL